MTTIATIVTAGLLINAVLIIFVLIEALRNERKALF